MDEAARGAISPTLNLGSTSALGQLKAISSSHLSELEDALMALWQSWDVETATGAALDRLVAFNGITRRPAFPSTVTMTLDLDAGTYPAGSLVVNLVGDANTRFVNTETITLVSDDPSFDAPFESDEDGPINAGAGQLTIITTPVLGFNSATNALDAEPGAFRETDPELRRRRAQELARKGSATVDAIRADILSVDGVTFARVVENDTDVEVGGIPAHAFESLVLGGDDADIAEAIFLTKPAGIQAFGSTVVSVADSQGAGHQIGFTRPTDVNIYLDVTVKYIGGQYVGDSQVKAILNDWGDANLGPGNDVIHARLLQVVMDIPGVVDADVSLGTIPTPNFRNNFVIGVREIARLDISRIDVIPISVTGVP